MIVTFVIMAVLAISAFGWISIARSEESQSSLAGDLSSFDAAEASAYRWNAMAKFYDARNESQSSLAGDLSSFDAAEASAYRWNAMAKFYDAQNESQSSLTSDLSSFSHYTTNIADYRFVAVEPGFWTRQATPAVLEMADIS